MAKDVSIFSPGDWPCWGESMGKTQPSGSKKETTDVVSIHGDRIGILMFPRQFPPYLPLWITGEEQRIKRQEERGDGS
jgi:hypothetical protein